MDFYIQEYGAVGDGNTLNTTAIQAAIDACFAAGGGRVVVADGVYMTGTVVLRSAVELYLAPNGTLLASPNCGRYDESSEFEMRPYPYNVILTGKIADYGDYPELPKKHVCCDALPRNRGCCLIYAERVENIAITGAGKIDGNGTCFVEKAPEEAHHYKKFRRIHAPTPPRIVFFAGCKNIKVEGITVTNGPAGWSFWIHDCDFVHFDKVKIICDLDYPNNDGIHINCSRDVTVSNCNIICSDDCVVVRANSRSLKENKVCERIAVNNCTMTTECAGIRVAFVGDGVVRNCVFSNIVMTDCTVGVLIELPDRSLIESDFGREKTLIENLRFSNIVMDRMKKPIVFKPFDGPQTEIEAIRNIYFDGITAIGRIAIQMSGTESVPIENVFFSNCRFTYLPDFDPIKLNKTKNVRFDSVTFTAE